MINLLIEKIKKMFRKEAEIYYGDLLVSTVVKRAIVDFKEYRKISFQNLNYGNLKDVNIILKNLPYLDNDVPHEIILDKNYQIKKILYILDGIGSLHRTNRELPALIKCENGKIIEEEYSSNQYYLKFNQGYSSFTIPKKIIYENGEIKNEGSNWHLMTESEQELEYIRTEHKEHKEIKYILTEQVSRIKTMYIELTHAEYKETIIRELNINIDNFKTFTLTDRIIINMYMNTSLYEHKLKELGIDPTREGVKSNLDVLKMLYI